jgi:hypothetical protein
MSNRPLGVQVVFPGEYPVAGIDLMVAGSVEAPVSAASWHHVTASAFYGAAGSSSRRG